jgi:hypothetical protein
MTFQLSAPKLLTASLLCAALAACGGGGGGSTPVASLDSAASPAPAPVTATPAPAPAPAAATTPAAPAPAPAPAEDKTVGPRVSSFASSGAITAKSGQTISGVKISNSSGACITVPSGVTNVTIVDSDIGPCGGNANIEIYGSGVTVQHNTVHDGNRGVLASHTGNVTTQYNKFNQFNGPKPRGTAIEYDYMTSGVIDSNKVTGKAYASDVLSSYESSNMRMTNNDIDVDIAEWSAAGFTMGDSPDGQPGGNNYVAGNIVHQTGGVPAGVFGSTGNTILEKNCLTAGIQAYNYAGVFNGVTVRNNVINIGASYVPDTSVIAGWSTNIDSTDCSKVPQ